MTVIFVDCNKHLERDPGRDRRQHGYVEFHGKSRRELQLHKVAQLLEVLELGRDYLQKKEKCRINTGLQVLLTILKHTVCFKCKENI